MVVKGQNLFTRDGALKNFFADLGEITEGPRFGEALAEISHKEMDAARDALRFLVTDLQKPTGPVIRDEDELDMDEL